MFLLSVIQIITLRNVMFTVLKLIHAMVITLATMLLVKRSAHHNGQVQGAMYGLEVIHACHLLYLPQAVKVQIWLISSEYNSMSLKYICCMKIDCTIVSIIFYSTLN